MPSRQTRQNRPRAALPEAGRKTHDPAIEASLPRSPSGRLADRPRAPSPFRKSRSAPPAHTESTKGDFVNGLLNYYGRASVGVTKITFKEVVGRPIPRPCCQV